MKSAPRKQRTPTEEQGLEITRADTDAPGHLVPDRLRQFFRGHGLAIVHDSRALFAHPHADDKVVYESIVRNDGPVRLQDRVDGPVRAVTRVEGVFTCLQIPPQLPINSFLRLTLVAMKNQSPADTADARMLE